MYRSSDSCHFFVCFRKHLVVRALFGQIVRRWTQEGCPDTVVEVWARSAHSGACGWRSKFFFSRREWIRRSPGISPLHEPYFNFHTYVLLFEFIVRSTFDTRYLTWCYLSNKLTPASASQLDSSSWTMLYRTAATATTAVRSTSWASHKRV